MRLRGAQATEVPAWALAVPQYRVKSGIEWAAYLLLKRLAHGLSCSPGAAQVVLDRAPDERMRDRLILVAEHIAVSATLRHSISGWLAFISAGIRRLAVEVAIGARFVANRQPKR